MTAKAACRVIETNVALVASGLCDTAAPGCVISCIEVIRAVLDDQTVLTLDDGDQILAEYAKKLSASGEPRVGDKFLKWVYINQYNPSRCQRVGVYPIDADGLEYAELEGLQNIEGFDSDDRKFLVTALMATESAPILNAVDSDWLDHASAITAAGVSVVFVCGEAACVRGA